MVLRSKYCRVKYWLTVKKIQDVYKQRKSAVHYIYTCQNIQKAMQFDIVGAKKQMSAPNNPVKGCNQSETLAIFFCYVFIKT